MSASVLPLRFLVDEGRFIKSPFDSLAPLQLPPFIAGNIVPVRLYAYQRSAVLGTAILPLDISARRAELSLGIAGERPSLGFWRFTLDSVSSSAIPARAHQDEVCAALNAISTIRIAGGVSVDGRPCDFLVTCLNVGTVDAPVISYEGEIPATCKVSVISAGDSSTPAQWHIEILSGAPAMCVAWQPYTLTPASSVASIGTSGALFMVTLDANAEGGLFVLVVGGARTAFISLFATAMEIENAVALSGNAGAGAQVVPGDAGSFFVSLRNAATLTIDDATLLIPPSLLGALDLSGAGVAEMLGSLAFQSCELSVRLDGLWTNATIGAILKNPIPPMQSSSTLLNPPIGTSQSVARYLDAITGWTGGGATNLDGVQTIQLPTGSLVTFIFNVDDAGAADAGGIPTEQDWEFIVDPNPGVTVSNGPAGVVVPLDWNSATNARVWNRRR